MIRIPVAISLIVLAMACAHKDAGRGLNKSSSQKMGMEREAAFRQDEEALLDSTCYIGYVDYFPETAEFYTTLFYRDGHEYPDEDLLESRLDSVIVLDDDWGRERLPMDEARKILVLTGLDSLTIYNRRHERVCQSALTRVEYLWNGLESYFIAVFKSDSNAFEQTEELYGISTGFFPLQSPSFYATEITDGNLDDFLKKELALNRNASWDMRHYRITAQETYSILSCYSITSGDSFSYLVKSEDDDVEIMNEQINSFHFLNILPVPVMMNGKPLLLISAGYPSSDVIWDYLAGYDEGRYDAIDYNRVHARSVPR